MKMRIRSFLLWTSLLILGAFTAALLWRPQSLVQSQQKKVDKAQQRSSGDTIVVVGNRNLHGKKLTRREIWEKLNPPFATSAEVEKWLASPNRSAMDFAMCGVIARRPDLIDAARGMNPTDEAVNLVWFFSNLEKNVTPENINNFKKIHPESAWVNLLSAKVELKKLDGGKALEFFSSITGDQTMIDTSKTVKNSFAAFLTDIRAANPKDSQNRDIGDLENFAFSHTLCDGLITDLSSTAFDSKQKDFARYNELLSAAWDIADYTKNWGSAVQHFDGLNRQYDLAQKAGYTAMAEILQQDPISFEANMNDSLLKAKEDFLAVTKFREEASELDFMNFLALAEDVGEVRALQLIEEARNQNK